ncbi:M48 family metalloprotease (plasmid) [Arthrobacter sp. YA7-1]|uniref:M56 family metallopeptidase n=1 Tax=Arthrobacter sp. YA7-1 TaxID=2987701 RepID=UPI00222771C2|nr:M56 family metallopeptidase [Arthrobacter sp. YA7-1]UYY83630.1 M48 family metalloprotease [Arthrobacter sp. YA7-1]
MIGVLGLLCYCAATVLLAPVVLMAGAWQVRRPRLALGLWHGVFASGLVAAGASLAWSVLEGVRVNFSTPAAGTPWILPTVLVLTGWISLGVVGAVAALVLQRAESILIVDRQSHGTVAALLELAAVRTTLVGRTRVSFVSVEEPVAFAAPGLNTIIISTVLEEVLDPAELRAVIEHERTHLLQRHGLVKRLARLNSACLPGVLCARRFERATNTLLELIADDRAARVCGHRAVSAALAKLAVIRERESMLLRAERLAARSGLGSGRRGVAAAGLTTRSDGIIRTD